MQTEIMDNRNRDRAEGEDFDRANLEQRSTVPGDLPDSPQDEEKLQAEEVIIDLPDVKDIPGQEFVHAPPLGELGDTTISSDDEEGKSVFDERSPVGTDDNVGRNEKKALQDEDYMPTRDEDNLRRAGNDEPEDMNEKGFRNQ